MKLIFAFLILIFIVSFTNCQEESVVDPNKPPVVIVKDCEKNNYGFFQFTNQTDLELSFFKTTDTYNPFITIPPYSAPLFHMNPIDSFYYKMVFENCGIHDKYGVLKFSMCDTTYFKILGNAVVKVSYSK